MLTNFKLLMQQNYNPSYKIKYCGWKYNPIFWSVQSSNKFPPTQLESAVLQIKASQINVYRRAYMGG